MINGSYKWSPMKSPGMSKTLHLNSIQLKLYQSGGGAKLQSLVGEKKIKSSNKIPGNSERKWMKNKKQACTYATLKSLTSITI